MLKLIRYKYTPYGGAENYLLRLSGALADRGIAHKILSSNSFGENCQMVEVPKILPSFAKILSFAKKVCGLKKSGELYFSLERIPCADIYRAGDGVHAGWIKKRLSGKGLLAKIALYANPLQSVYLYLEKHCFLNATKIIANSEFVKRQIVSNFSVDGSKIEVIHNGYDRASVTREQKATLKEEFGITSQKVLLFVGSGFYRKGVAELLGLASKLEGDFKLLIVGKEKRLDSYKRLAKGLGLGDRVVFTGARKDAAVFYEIADIFVFPTLYEPFSNVCLEAMAHECAVITTANNGAAELLSGEFVMRDENDSTIVPIIQKMVENCEFLDQIKQKNSEIAQKLSVNLNLEKTLKVIQAVENSY